MPAIDLLGQTFGRLTVIADGGSDKDANKLWHCRCDCGGNTLSRGTSLRFGTSQSCGCISRDKARLSVVVMRAKKKSPYHKDILGQRFGRLTVIADGGNDKWQSRYWLCRCDCGTEKIILGHALRQGATKSCGCLQRAEVQIAPGMKLTRLTVLASAGKDKHYSKRWLCRCDCGTEKVIGNLALQNGTTQSCGCLQKERAAELATARLVPAAKKRTIAYRRERGWPEDVPITPITKAQRTIFSQTVAKAIRVRDNFKCVLCGECAGVVHHIKPWARHEELRFEPLNLVTLCKACHVDKAHAGKPNTKTDPVVAGYLTAYVANHHNEKEWRDILAYIQSMPVKTPEERKQARREYMKVRNAQPEIRARAIENQRKRCAANPEQAAQCARQWRERNRERYNANARKWYAANRERACAAKYAWRDRNETELVALVVPAEATD